MSIAITHLGAAILLTAALVSDVRSMRIPNWLTVPALAAGMIFRLAFEGWDGAWSAVIGAGAGFLPLMALYLLKGIGAGDVKLFAALGAWIGGPLVLQSLMYAILYAGLIGLVLLLVLRPFGRRILNGIMLLLIYAGVPGSETRFDQWGTEKSVKFPFMLAAFPGALTAWLFT